MVGSSAIYLAKLVDSDTDLIKLLFGVLRIIAVPQWCIAEGITHDCIHTNANKRPIFKNSQDLCLSLMLM